MNSTITLDPTNSTVKAVVAQVKADMKAEGRYAKYAEEFGVDKDNLADHARAIAVACYPHDEPVQKKNGTRTRFGNAVQAAGKGLRGTLPKTETETDWLRLVKQAAENAHSKGEFSPERILAAVSETLAETNADAA